MNLKEKWTGYKRTTQHNRAAWRLVLDEDEDTSIKVKSSFVYLKTIENIQNIEYYNQPSCKTSEENYISSK